MNLNPPHKYSNIPYDLLHKAYLDRLDGAIAVSKLMKEHFLEYTNLDIPVVVSSTFLREKRFEELGRITGNLSSRKITISNNLKRKGIDLAVKAFKLVKEKYEDLELFILGKGTKKWDNGKDIHGEGWTSEVGKYLSSLGLLLQPSRFDAFAVTVL
ncbi:hypothetical protein AKJ55_01020 [candidate division MSBL1 archaeon SCGC-AAA382M17]|uniref:Glycosyl transferase family 1 domain-containing protein n=1 Tax=candidate division MSBL1 archaeon SCGC-AAA382M17 TaxID=1698284 RepID=A0ABR5TJL7_9EURY|nr:hypothetical protein AKJ55_01020 [candidate division MSBL1 archaeon SCGC-AAA382M17]